MTVSETLNDIVDGKQTREYSSAMLRMLEISRTLGYDLDDFLFEIWKETLND